MPRSRGSARLPAEPCRIVECPYATCVNICRQTTYGRRRHLCSVVVVGRLVETWVMEMATRARTAETPKPTSHLLRPYAPHFYPDIRTHGSVRGVEVGGTVRSCGTLGTERQEQQRTQTLPNQRAIVRLLDQCEQSDGKGKYLVGKELRRIGPAQGLRRTKPISGVRPPRLL